MAHYRNQTPNIVYMIDFHNNYICKYNVNNLTAYMLVKQIIIIR